MARIHVLDCTIRDGGLMNRWQFDPAFVRRQIAATRQAGSDYVELGYKASTALFSPEDYGVWRFCAEDVLREFWPEGGPRLTVMLDVGRFDLRDLPRKSESVVGAVRVATYVAQMDEAVAMTHHLDELGYETFLNIMAVSEAEPTALDHALVRAADSPVSAVYVVDSYGHLGPAPTRDLVRRYGELSGKAVGFHGHNNLQLALANSLAAVEAGAVFVDASLGGMGRGAGNTPLELLLPQLGTPLNQLAGLLALLETDVAALRHDLRWGYEVPYIIAGLANQHPREAMDLMDRRVGAVASGYLDRVAVASCQSR